MKHQKSMLSRSRSQNHYYIQANQFQKRYSNSIYKNFRNDQKHSTCCPTHDKSICNCNNQNNYYPNDSINITNPRMVSQYYQNSYVQKINNQKTLQNLQVSKRYLQDMLDKSLTSRKIIIQKSDKHIFSIQDELKQKNQQINSLNAQILRLKKLLENPNQSTHSRNNKSYSKNQSYSNNPFTLQIESKQKIIKQLQRYITNQKQQIQYQIQQLQVKNRQIEQIRQKNKLKQDSNQLIQQQLNKEIYKLNDENQILIKKINHLQNRYHKINDQNNILKIKSQKQVHQCKSIQIKYNQLKLSYQNLMKIQNHQKSKIQAQFQQLSKKIRSKDSRIQELLCRLKTIQSEFSFFRQKFTNLLFQIQREQRQSNLMIQQATFLKQHGQRLHQELTKSFQYQRKNNSQIHDIYNPKNSIQIDRSMISNIGFSRKVTDQRFQKINQRFQMKQSQFQYNQVFPNLNQVFPNLNLSISPIRNK